MISGFNNDGAASLPTRAQSPINMPRGAHPGAVLLSPKRTAISSFSGNGGGSSSGAGSSTQLLSPPQHPLSLNDILDQQHSQPQLVEPSCTLSLDASIQHPLASSISMNSPLLQPQASSLSVTNTFLDSFGSRPSSAVGAQQQQQHQSVSHNSNPMVNFTNGVNQVCSWMTMLTTAQQNTVMDNLLSSLNEEVLQHTKWKLDSLTNSGYLSPSLRPIASPIPNRVTVDNSTPLSSIQLPGAVTLDSVLSDSASTTANAAAANCNNINGNSLSVKNLYRQWSPNPQGSGTTQPMFDYLNEITRPRSADPSRLRTTQNSHHYQNSHHSTNNNTSSNNVSHDGSSGNGSNNNSHNNVHGHQHSNSQSGNRFSNIKAVRPQSPSSAAKATSVNSSFTEIHPLTMQSTTPATSNSGASSNTSGSSNMNTKSLCDPKLLKNIPAWLKSLRLHKYSGSLNGKNWQELIELDDLLLEEMGVSALGARRKLLKAFAIVKECKEKGLIDESAY
ncbi:Vts1p Ecym_5026 [Eremothecium cymbalariae DBVPG|uniref:SAM domain-containing protein n=1 Tax=Eremothecium cymbalariae (strain CBS 270.75 / DBVPG 7215 / KCTC 17166 / NRRL Y-17582) TaxID=931890 RepID=I6NCN4_ERECY|nr:hypothetical protein Ecym_5026 [Eremothecium cymbalariae DBVPG\